MKNMKKAIAALAAGVMALTIAACGGGSGSNTASKIHNDKKANDSAQCQNKVKKARRGKGDRMGLVSGHREDRRSVQ